MYKGGLLTSSSKEVYYPLSQPLMPMKLVKIRNFSAVVVVGCVGQMVYYALNLFWPIIITTFFTTDNIKIGLMSVSIPNLVNYPLAP